MIDEKKLIEEIESLTVSMGGMQLFHTQAKQSVIKTIDEQPRVGEWIPCSERLPKEYVGVTGTLVSKEVLVSLKSGLVWVARTIRGRWTSDEVVAWMPLPEPYKGGKE